MRGPPQGAKRTVQTGDSGIYVLAALPLGSCGITVRANGFQEQRTDKTLLSVGETRTLDFQLGIKTTLESVVVVASTAALEQSSAETGGVNRIAASAACP